LKSDLTAETHDIAVLAIRERARDIMSRVMNEQGIDIVIANSDSTLVSYTSSAHWPVITVPVGNLAKNGQPWGFFALARTGREDLLLRFAAAFYKTFPGPDRPTRCFESAY